jgi:anti-sigma factor RsiW
VSVIRHGSGCNGVGDILQVYVDGECDDDTAVVVAAHLHMCPTCDGEAETYRWLKAALRRQRIEDPDAVSRLCAFAALLTRRCPG